MRTRFAALLVVVFLMATCAAPGTPTSVTTSSSPVSASSPTAASDAFDRLVASAKAEGQLTVYSVMTPAQMQARADAFTAKYGIKVEFAGGGSDALVIRVTEELRGGISADVMEPGAVAYLETFRQNGQLLKLDRSRFPDATGWSDKYLTDYYALASISPNVIGYNTKLVTGADIPKDWPDVLNPKFKGKVGVTDPNVIAAGYILVLLREKYGDTFLQSLGMQARLFSAVQANLVASGELAMYIGTHTSFVELKRTGAPVDWVVPATTAGTDRVTAILANAKHPNAALLWFNYTLSREGQQVMNGQFGGFSVLDGIPGTLPLPADLRYNDLPKAQAQLRTLLTLLGKG